MMHPPKKQPPQELIFSLNNNQHGRCYLVGAGPGDPGLLTLRAQECLTRAHVVLYDYLCNAELLDHAPNSAEKIYVGKSASNHALTQEEINALLVEKTKKGLTVVRLKGGDPFLFGRGGEEAEALAQAGLYFEVVPGVTSAIGGLAYAGIPVTHRDSNSQLTIFTGHEDPKKEGSSLNFHSLAHAPGTKVMLMGIERLASISASLISAGMEERTPVALVRWATTGRHQTMTGTLANIANLAKEAQFSAPAIAVFGEVVHLHKKLNWFEKRPLFGRKIAVTRTREQASKLMYALRELGADAYELPTIRIEKAQKEEEQAMLQEIITDVHQYDWIIFTSPNGVTFFFEEFFKRYQDARSLGALRLAAIGPSTAEKIREYRFSVDLLPPEFIAESLLEEFRKIGVENLRILLPRAREAREFLVTELQNLGAIVDDLPLYCTLPELEEKKGLQRFFREGADLITFTSGSTAEHFQTLLKKRGVSFPKNCITASIGPQTSSVMKKVGIDVQLEAKQHDIPGLLEVILNYFTSP